jgi:hypothetical protein
MKLTKQQTKLHDEAMALALPNVQMMARLRTGQPLGPLDLVEDAEAAALTPHAHRERANCLRSPPRRAV